MISRYADWSNFRLNDTRAICLIVQDQFRVGRTLAKNQTTKSGHFRLDRASKSIKDCTFTTSSTADPHGCNYDNYLGLVVVVENVEPGVARSAVLWILSPPEEQRASWGQQTLRPQRTTVRSKWYAMEVKCSWCAFARFTHRQLDNGGGFVRKWSSRYTHVIITSPAHSA